MTMLIFFLVLLGVLCGLLGAVVYSIVRQAELEEQKLAKLASNALTDNSPREAESLQPEPHQETEAAKSEPAAEPETPD